MESLDKQIRDVLQVLEKMIEEGKGKEDIDRQRKILDGLLDEYLKDL